MLRLTCNNVPLTGIVHLDSTGTVEHYLDRNGVVLAAPKQHTESSWASEINSRRATDALLGGTYSDDPNGDLVVTVDGATMYGWAFSEGLRATYIFNGGTAPYLTTLNAIPPGSDGELTLLPNEDVDISVVTGVLETISTSATAGEEFPYSNLDPSTPLYTLNESAGGSDLLVISTSMYHYDTARYTFHSNPAYALYMINKFIWYLYKAFNSIAYRLLNWNFSQEGFSGFGLGLNTYDNYQAIVSFLSLYSWQQSFVLRGAPTNNGASIVFGYIEPECSHDNFEMDLTIDIVNPGPDIDTASRQPFALYMTGVDSSIEEGDDTTKLYQKWEFGYVGGTGTWVEVDGSGQALTTDDKYGYNLFLGGSCHIKLDHISVTKRYVLGLALAPVSGGNDYTKEYNYPSKGDKCILVVNGTWKDNKKNCVYAKTINVGIEALLQGSTVSGVSGYTTITNCTSECGPGGHTYFPNCGSVGAVGNYRKRCKVIKVPTAATGPTLIEP